MRMGVQADKLVKLTAKFGDVAEYITIKYGKGVVDKQLQLAR